MPFAKCHRLMARNSAWRLKVVFAFIGFLLWPREAAACPVCWTGFFWDFFPPLVIWPFIGLVWYLPYAWILLTCKPKPEPFKKVKWGGPWLIPALFVAFFLTGPVAFLPLLAISFHMWLKSISHKDDNCSPRIQKTVRVIGWIGFTLCIVAANYQFYAPSPRVPLDSSLKMKGISLSPERMEFWRETEPDSIDSYRVMISRPLSVYTAIVADRLAEIGDPDVDGVFISRALKKAEAEGPLMSDTTDRLREALEKINRRAEESPGQHQDDLRNKKPPKQISQDNPTSTSYNTAN